MTSANVYSAHEVDRDKPFTLVLSGSSTKVFLHIGAVKAVEDAGIDINEIYCNSGGSIVGAALACGWDSERLVQFGFELDIESVIRQHWYDYFKNIRNSVSLVPGHKLFSVIKKITGNARFKDLVDIDLYLMAHSLSEERGLQLSKYSVPDTEVALGVRASASVPILFEPVRVAGHYMVDGGIYKDFPVDLARKQFVGHCLDSDKSEPWKEADIFPYALSLINQMISANVHASIDAIKSPGIVVKTKYSKPITDFKVSDAEKEEMFQIGYDNMEKSLRCLFETQGQTDES